MSCSPETHVDAIPSCLGQESGTPELYSTPELDVEEAQTDPDVVPMTSDSPMYVTRSFSDLVMRQDEIDRLDNCEDGTDATTITAEECTPTASDDRDEKLIRSIERLQMSIDDLTMSTGRSRRTANRRQRGESGPANTTDRAGYPGGYGQRGRGRGKCKDKNHHRTPLSYSYVEGEE